jgi:phosphatidylglycerophosphate synthase
MSDDRRPLTSRDQGWAKRTAAWLAKQSITPNQISVLSILFAAIAAALMHFNHAFAWLGAAVAIQCRLLCNLFDGMIAMEGGKATPTGGIYNDLPDRIADPLLLIAAGYTLPADWQFLGWLAALLAVLTAYIRLLGASLGTKQDFRGPMAKQHRMALLTLASLGVMVELLLVRSFHVMLVALVLINIGCVLTCANRLINMARALKASVKKEGELS